MASRDHSSIGRPASTTNALGRSAPRRSPLPAATRRAAAFMRLTRSRETPLRGGLLAVQQLVEVLLGLLLRLLERVHQLGRQDLLGAGVHLLLARGETLLLLAHGEGADDFGELVDVAGLDLVAVVLEAPVPVLRHLRTVGGQHPEDLLDRLL